MLDWRDYAKCRGMRTDVFFPRSGRGRNAPGAGWLEAVAQAKAVCATCVVRGACLDDALEYDDHGIRGGLTADERASMWRRTVAKCGTDSGYYRHRNQGGQPCDDCKAAHSAANSRRASEARGVPPHPRHGATG